jgi:malonyl CoA-acyl carrier protein transacylase
MESSNVQVVEAINHIQAATMGNQVVLTSGAGKAYQSVAQSSAIAVQDSADTLRNLSTIATTAIGVAMAQLLATKDPSYATVITTAQQVIKNATDEFAQVGATAAAIVKEFPAG